MHVIMIIIIVLFFNLKCIALVGLLQISVSLQIIIFYLTLIEESFQCVWR